MKYLLFIGVTIFSLSVNAEERVFHLEDLAEKINGGMNANQYCTKKANTSAKQAKAANAPLEAQIQIKKWVAIACSLDIIDEPKRNKKTLKTQDVIK
jgi:hypothetical protein